MRDYVVEVHGGVRELYFVQANTAEEAAENWDEGTFIQSEAADGFEVTNVTEETYE